MYKLLFLVCFTLWIKHTQMYYILIDDLFRTRTQLNRKYCLSKQNMNTWPLLFVMKLAHAHYHHCFRAYFLPDTAQRHTAWQLVLPRQLRRPACGGQKSSVRVAVSCSSEISPFAKPKYSVQSEEEGDRVWMCWRCCITHGWYYLVHGNQYFPLTHKLPYTHIKNVILYMSVG